ncbi:hypothetical protein [Streptomyces lushanensis]|uniref:hypothetical protein n=1 Tax=Streptomyces lushanensis TaxID=1434255 RepID=UPI00082EFB76|nr:hypothetical protein [Streptomyces lushanensis]
MSSRVATGIGDRLLDRALATAVVRAGAPARVRFTERQLYYEMCRVLRPLHTVPRRIPLTPAPPVRYERFEEALRRYGEVPGLLDPVPAGPPPGSPSGSSAGSSPGPAAGPSAVRRTPEEPDLYDYGLPRLLICQSRSVARMLLANDIHLEGACPVLAADGLPLDPRLVAGLGRVDGATVHVLHDASTAGIALTARVRAGVTGVTGVDGVRVASMGLVPRHAASLHLVSPHGPAPGPGPAQTDDGQALPSALGPRERDWLAGGRFAEVESVPPARLLRTVLRVVRGPRMPSHSLWTGLRELRTAGFMTWPTGRPGDTRTRGDEPATRNTVQR